MSARSHHRVLVIGAGVSGLTTALCLRRDGFAVTVCAESFAPQVTSVVAGALWEWPPAICGHHKDSVSLARSKNWCRASYDIFDELAGDPATGVFLRPAVFYFREPIVAGSPQHRKMCELREHVRGFVHDPGLAAANGVNPAAGVRDAYAHLAPMVDTDAYMAWLLRAVRDAGCEVVRAKLAGPLHVCEAELRSRFDADAIVNCSGLGAGVLAGDAMYPLRGALVRVRNDGRHFPRITVAHCLAHDGADREPGFVFIVPRGTDWLILGGIAESDRWDLDVGLHNYEPIRTMFRRCRDFLPALENAEPDPHEPVRVGLRPFRKDSVRLEREAHTRIVHNYGHGGAGVTLSWGCAREAAGLVRTLLSEALAME